MCISTLQKHLEAVFIFGEVVFLVVLEGGELEDFQAEEDEVDSEEEQETPPHAKARSRRSGILGRLVGSCASVKEKSSTSPRKLRSRSKGKSKKLAKKYVFKYFC